MYKFWNFARNETTGESELFLYGPIADETWFGDEVTPQYFRDELAKNKGNLTVWINSPGGDVVAASQIYTMLKNHSGKVRCLIDGIAASAATIIAMAGDETLISPTGMMMIHNPSGVAIGNKEAFQQAIKVLDESKETIINAYVTKSHLARDKIAKMMDAETWMNANKALELGFVDGILFKENQQAEPQKTTENAVTTMSWSHLHTQQSLFMKISASAKGVPVEQLRKRLNLLK